MPSDPQPVTEEMVATFKLGPDPLGRGKLTLFYGKGNYVWLENLPGFGEAAQAVAPPKETASEITRLQAVIERDRSAAAHWIEAARKTLNGHRWATETRGSYAWDDERFFSEGRALFKALDKILDNAQRDTHSSDLTDSPTTWEAVTAARQSSPAAPATEEPEVEIVYSAELDRNSRPIMKSSPSGASGTEEGKAREARRTGIVDDEPFTRVLRGAAGGRADRHPDAGRARA